MIIDKLSIGLGLDLTALDDDLRAASDRVTAFGESDAVAGVGAMGAGTGAAGGGGAGGDPGKGADESAGKVVELGARIRSALESGLAPLAGMSARISAQLDAIGGTVVTLARRIDNSMKFPAAEAAVKTLKAKIESGIASASQKSAEDLTRVEKAVLKLGPAASAAASGFLAFQKVKGFFDSFGDVAGKSLSQLKKIEGVDLGRPAAGAARLEAGVRAVDPPAKQLTATVKGLGTELAIAFGAFGLVSKVVGFFKDGILEASHLNETVSKTEVVLGSAAGSMKAFADEMADKFGIVKRETLDAASAFGGLGKNLGGLSGDGLAKFAKENTKLAADLASQMDITFKEASKALTIGLAGNQSDTLRELGAIVTETTVKEYALAHGIAASGKELSEQEKLMARTGLIAERLKDASGDLERTQGSVANQFRKAGGGVTNFGATIGQVLLPAVQAGTTAFNELLATTIEVFENNRTRIEGWANAVKGGIEFAGMVLRNFGTLWKIAELRAVEAVANVLAAVDTMPANLARVGEWFANNWSKLILDGLALVGQGVRDLATNFVNFGSAVVEFFKDPTKGFKFEWKGLNEGFRATADALPEMVKPAWVSMQSEIDKLGREMAEREAKRAGKIVSTAKDPAKVAADARDKDEKAPKLAKAAEIGSKDAYRTIAEFQAKGATGDKKALKEVSDTAKKQLAEARKQTEALRQIARRPPTPTAQMIRI